MQDLRGEIHLGAMQIVFAQNQAERLDGKEIPAAGVTQNVAPSAGSLDPVAAAAGYRRSTSGVDDDAIAMIERRREARITVAARHDFRVRPDLKADSRQRATVFICAATGKENSSAIDLRRQFGKDGAQAFGRGEPKIRRVEFSLFENAKFTTGITDSGYGFNKRPGGFRAAAFHAEDAFTGFHD
jgi:hypothetical protein